MAEPSGTPTPDIEAIRARADRWLRNDGGNSESIDAALAVPIMRNLLAALAVVEQDRNEARATISGWISADARLRAELAEANDLLRQLKEAALEVSDELTKARAELEARV